MRTEFKFDTNDIGHITSFNPTTTPGVSERKKIVSVINGFPTYVGNGTTERKTTKEQQRSKFNNWVEDDCNRAYPDETEFNVKAWGNYAFVRYSPDIDYNINLMAYRYSNGEVKVRLRLTHDMFPDYEALINGKLLINFQTQGTGPTISNLTTTTRDNATVYYNT